MSKYYYIKFTKENRRQIKSLLLAPLILALAIFLPLAKANSQGTVSPLPAVSYDQRKILSNSAPLVTPTPNTPTPVSTPIPSQKTNEKKYTKNSYAIVLYGDSMVDTMGKRLEYLEGSLKKQYPNLNFNLFNFGKGAENVEMGLLRWEERFDYQNRHYPAIDEVKPDIIILGSFAYNPFSPYDRNRHWLNLTKMIEKARKITPHVYLLAEIAPLRDDFGKGPNGVNWDKETAYSHSGQIVEQLENTVGLARSLEVPLINAFSKSGGQISYVNPNDGIHPSVSGHRFTADLIASTIKLW